MRLKAIELMQRLECFSPRLIGSVSTGKIKQTSDIDLHVFCDDIELLTLFLEDENITFEQQKIFIMKNNNPTRYQHIYIVNEFNIELSVYPINELRVTGKSSTDGKAIVRMSISKLEKLIEEEHWELLLKTNGY